MAGSKSKPKAVEAAKKMGKKRPNSALTDGEEIEKTQQAKRRKDPAPKTKAPQRKRGRPPGVKKSRKVEPSVTALTPPAVEGCVLTLGEGDTGQLGLGPDVLERTKPGKVNVPNMVQICAGGMHSVCLTTKGEVYTFGCNDDGGLGRETEEESEPGKVDLPAKIVLVSAGDSHSAALSKDGKIYIWGSFRDANGSMGITSSIKIQKTPMEVDLKERIVHISSGNDHVAALTDDGEIYTFGNSEQGQLGRVPECFSNRGGRKGLDFILTPAPVHFKKRKARFSDVWCGQYHTFAKDKDTNEIYSWGLNNYYQLGFSDMKNRFVPERVKSFSPNKNWKSIAGGQHHTLAIDKDGQVYSLGRKEYGRLGLGEENLAEKSEPTAIDGLKGKKCEQISAGTATSFAVDDNGKIYAWGMGTSNQLGQKDDDDLFEPAELTGKQLETRNAVQIGAGGQHVIILAKDR